MLVYIKGHALHFKWQCDSGHWTFLTYLTPLKLSKTIQKDMYYVDSRYYTILFTCTYTCDGKKGNEICTSLLLQLQEQAKVFDGLRHTRRRLRRLCTQGQGDLRHGDANFAKS